MDDEEDILDEFGYVLSEVEQPVEEGIESVGEFIDWLYQGDD